ncbi:MAG: hypothetical protein Q9212_002941 [Teloschistes hypoglaucus]
MQAIMLSQLEALLFQFSSFLSTTTGLHCPGLNRPKESKYTVLRPKLALTALRIMGPEVILKMVMGEWMTARQCVRDFNSKDLKQSQTHTQEHQRENATEKRSAKEVWTMEIAFFVDMGGFQLCARNCEPFSLDARQLLYLARKGYIQQPVFKPRVIDDEKNVDVPGSKRMEGDTP